MALGTCIPVEIIAL